MCGVHVELGTKHMLCCGQRNATRTCVETSSGYSYWYEIGIFFLILNTKYQECHLSRLITKNLEMSCLVSSFFPPSINSYGTTWFLSHVWPCSHILWNAEKITWKLLKNTTYKTINRLSVYGQYQYCLFTLKWQEKSYIYKRNTFRGRNFIAPILKYCYRN